MTLDSLPPAVLAVVGLLVVVQIGLDVLALVILFRTPPERLVFGSRWPWLAIILLVNLIGAILFLAIARTPAPALDPSTPGAPGAPAAPAASGAPAPYRRDTAHAAVDLLYPPSDQTRRP